MADKLISQRELARLLKISTQQIANLVAQGMPTEEREGKRLYPDASCVAWYVRRKLEASTRSKEGEEPDPKDRVDGLRADLMELELAEKRGALMTTGDFERTLTDSCSRVDAKLKNLPQRIASVNWSPDLAERVRQAHPLVDEIRAELARADDVPSPAGAAA